VRDNGTPYLRFAGNDGRIELIENVENLSSIFTIGASVDVIKFTGGTADSLRDISSSAERSKYVLVLMAALHFEGLLTSAIANDDLAGFITDVATSNAPVSAVDSFTFSIGGTLISGLISLYQGNGVLDVIEKSSEDVFLGFPELSRI
jgi:hypothetical protein